MALNYSHRHLFPAHLADDNLVSPFGIMNGYLVEGDKSGESSTRCWHTNLDEEKEKNYGCFAAESDPVDIVDLLPSDPFGMDIQTTFTAITGWLEDLEFNYNGYMSSNDGNSGVNDFGSFGRCDFLWNHGLSFQPFPNTAHCSERSNVDVPHSSSNLNSDVVPFMPHKYFPETLPFNEKKIHNPVNSPSEVKDMEARLDICDTRFFHACSIFDAVRSEGGK